MTNLPFIVDPMTLADAPAAVTLEQVVYANPDLLRDFAYEVTQNSMAHYFVLRQLMASSPQSFIGLAGFWLMTDEAHIMTVALHPRWQGLGLGEYLFLTLLEQAKKLNAKIATLEVRPSNHTARALYRKYAFQEDGHRPRYYADDGEDALILSSPLLHSPDYSALLTQYKANLLPRLLQIKIDKMTWLD